MHRDTVYKNRIEIDKNGWVELKIQVQFTAIYTSKTIKQYEKQYVHFTLSSYG